MTEPTSLARIGTLDTIRGVAVMGILLMNIVGFGLVDTAYMNPRAQGGATGIDLSVYLVNFVLFDGKMRGLFSFLFGASTLLVIERATAKGESAAKVHYSRMFWLLIFGLAHLYLIWWGDILNHYALVGGIAFLFRKRQVKTLVIVGCVLLLVQFVLLSGLPFIVNALQSGGQPGMTAEQIAEQMRGFEKGFGVPDPEWIAERVATYRGDYAGILAARWEQAATSPITSLVFIGAETLAYMLFGMAGLKSGMLRGEWSPARYRKWLIVGFGIGIPAYIAIAAYLVRADFSTLSVVLGVMTLTVPVRPLMILGWASLIILLAARGGALVERIAAAGRMAFTNYLATSVICSTIFYGYGFGLYGQLSRAELYLVVFAVWAGMLLWSKPWLERHQYGPLEWLWRSLSRLSFQPMRGGALAGRRT